MMKIYLFFKQKFLSLRRIIKKFIYKLGNNKRCVICNRHLKCFLPFTGTKLSYFIKKLEIVGSDINNFNCPHCGSTDRERHLFLYFSKLKIDQIFKDAKVLHFAPEKHLTKIIKKHTAKEYIKADLFPKDKETMRVDACAIPFPNNYFKVIIFNHILEHIPDYKKAISELYRVLQKDGLLIAQTPYSKKIDNNFEGESITNPKDREYFFGQFDHLRVFSEKHFLDCLKDAGFIIKVYSHKETLKEYNPSFYGVNKYEDFLLIKK